MYSETKKFLRNASRVAISIAPARGVTHDPHVPEFTIPDPQVTEVTHGVAPDP